MSDNDKITIQLVQESIVPTLEEPNKINVEVASNPLEVEITPGAGPQGDKGDSGAGASVTRTAGEILSGGRIVFVDGGEKVYYADHDNLGCAKTVLGLTAHAADIDEDVEIFLLGEVTDPAFSFTAGLPIYLGTNGLLTQVLPTSGFVLQVAVVTAEHTLVLNLGIPIVTDNILG